MRLVHKMRRIKMIFRKILPSTLINTCKKIVYYKRTPHYLLKEDYLYDYKRFLQWSSTYGIKTKENADAFLIREYHSIEKGLSLEKIKKGFGLERIKNLLDFLQKYLIDYGKNDITDITIKVLAEYYEFEKNNINNPLLIPINELLKSYVPLKYYNKGGVKTVYKKDIIESVNFDFGKFFKSRNSVRDFSTEPVDINTVVEAIKDSLYTPSVCNRQAWKVYVIPHENTELKAKLLSLQNGNKGFGESISTLIVVTSKISSFFEYERNQLFIDGGMFAMSLLLSLHSKALGTCCLNTSYRSSQTELFLQSMNMDKDVVPIMFIGVGNLKNEYKVAVSSRKNIDEILEIKI